MSPDLIPLLTKGATAVHLAALVPALACALTADLVAVTTLFGPLDPAKRDRLVRLHRTIVFALGIMWLSGLTLVLAKLLPGGPGPSPKLLAKLSVVTLLTANAQIIGAIALPRILRLGNQTFADLPAGARAHLGVIGGLSSSAWGSALLLGALPVFKPMGYGELAQIIGPILGLGMAGGAALALLAPGLRHGLTKGDLAGRVAPR